MSKLIPDFESYDHQADAMSYMLKAWAVPPAAPMSWSERLMDRLSALSYSLFTPSSWPRAVRRAVTFVFPLYLLLAAILGTLLFIVTSILDFPYRFRSEVISWDFWWNQPDIEP